MGTTITREELERLALALGVTRPREAVRSSVLLERCLEAAERELRMRAGLDRTQPAPPRTEPAPPPFGSEEGEPDGS